MTAYLIDLRTSRVRWAALICVLFAVFYLFSSTGWLGSWGQTVQAVTNAYTLGLVVTAAAAAWDIRRDLSPASVLAPDRGSRPALHGLFCRWAALTTWTMGGYLIVLVTAGAATMTRVPAVDVPALQVAVAVVGITAYMTLGLVLGRFLPLIVAVPVALLLPYLLTVLLAADPDRPAAFFTPLDDGILTVGYTLRRAVAWGEIAWFVAVTAAIVLVVAHTLEKRSTPISTSALVAASALVGVLVLASMGLGSTGGGRVVATDARGPRTCTDDGRVCLWRDHEYLLRATDATVRRMFAGDPRPQAPRTFVEHGLRPGRGAAVIDFATNDPDSYSVARAVAAGAIGYGVCTSPEPAVTSALLERQEWLTLRALPGGQMVDTTFTAVTDVMKAPVDRQWAWFDELTC